LEEINQVQEASDAIDGMGLRNSDKHVVILQQAGDAPPFIANWRVQGPGKE